MEKRTFLKTVLGASLLPLGINKLEDLLTPYNHLNPEELAEVEEFWTSIRQGYHLKPDYINLENGYYCFIPQATLDAFIENIKEVNYHGAYYMRNYQWDEKDKAAARLAKLIGAEPHEVIITRNTTESLDTIIGGFGWQAGDEAVYADQDYGSMKNMFAMMEQRHGIVNKIIDVPLHPLDDQEVVDAYAAAITNRTKLLMVCHIINITGHILPIQKICDMAHARGVQVMVDGAHAVGHFNFDIKELDCDYYGSSLHKWLSTPLGAGLLYVREGYSRFISPMFASWGHADDDIKKLNHTGTHPCHTDLSINNAIDYLDKLSLARKEARLRWLQHRWSEPLRAEPNVIINTPADPSRHAGIGNIGLVNMKPAELARRLMGDYNIYTVAIDGHGVQGCRITPNIYTSAEEIDVFVDAIRALARA